MLPKSIGFPVSILLLAILLVALYAAGLLIFIYCQGGVDRSIYLR